MSGRKVEQVPAGAENPPVEVARLAGTRQDDTGHDEAPAQTLVAHHRHRPKGTAATAAHNAGFAPALGFGHGLEAEGPAVLVLRAARHARATAQKAAFDIDRRQRKSREPPVLGGQGVKGRILEQAGKDVRPILLRSLHLRARRGDQCRRFRIPAAD